MQVSRSGQTRRPCSQMSSPTLTTARIASPGAGGGQDALQEAGAADPADENGDLHAPIVLPAPTLSSRRSAEQPGELHVAQPRERAVAADERVDALGDAANSSRRGARDQEQQRG